MRVQVLLFGPLAQRAGDSSVAVELADGDPTAGDVLQALRTQAPALRDVVDACRLAVNCAFAADETPVRPQDEVALVGLVSGG